jgi:hypothetical protein
VSHIEAEAGRLGDSPLAPASVPVHRIHRFGFLLVGQVELIQQ